MKNFDYLVALMDDEKREKVHELYSPCSEEEFVDRYLELDTTFEDVIKQFN